jgi:hypothetical protein
VTSRRLFTLENLEDCGTNKPPYFCRMSSSVSPRPLSLVPFFAADGVLLLTALLIAWGASGELAGGALLGVIVCTGLGAVLTVLPFVLNDAREREAALAERQRELVELVNSSAATASRWGTQWTAAATGLEDAAGLAARSIATAERLPAVFQEKIDAFSRLLEQAELSAKDREEQLEARAQAREERAVQQVAALTSRGEQAGAVATELERTLAGFGRMETGLREQHAALAALLAEFPVAAARAQSARAELDERLAAAPAQIEARIEAQVGSHIARVITDSEARLSATTEAISGRLTGLEAALDALMQQLDRVKALEVPVIAVPAVAAVSAVTPASTPAAAPAVLDAPVQVLREEAVVVTEASKPVVPKEAIMDPFYIPSNGYSALADAMDSGGSH